MLALLRPPLVPGRISAGLLVVRVALGLTFVQYGFAKAEHPLTWAAAIGLASLPPVVQALVAAVELGGGLLLLLGALTPLAALFIVLDMLGAVVTFVLPHHGIIWISSSPRLTLEKNVIYAACALTLMLAGPGAFSIDAWFSRARVRTDKDGLAREWSSTATS